MEGGLPSQRRRLQAQAAPYFVVGEAADGYQLASRGAASQDTYVADGYLQAACQQRFHGGVGPTVAWWCAHPQVDQVLSQAGNLIPRCPWGDPHRDGAVSLGQGMSYSPYSPYSKESSSVQRPRRAA